jgi:hypothetical protein
MILVNAARRNFSTEIANYSYTRTSRIILWSGERRSSGHDAVFSTNPYCTVVAGRHAIASQVLVVAGWGCGAHRQCDNEKFVYISLWWVLCVTMLCKNVLPLFILVTRAPLEALQQNLALCSASFFVTISTLGFFDGVRVIICRDDKLKQNFLCWRRPPVMKLL